MSFVALRVLGRGVLWQTILLLFGCHFAISSSETKPERRLTYTEADSLALDSGKIAKKENIVNLNTIVVHGRKTSSYAVSTTELLAEDFQGRHADVASLLNTVSGVTIFRTGGLGAYADMAIRGSGSNQVQIFLDGLPLNTAAGGSVDLSKIPLTMLQSATVYKSAAPLELSGMNAGGVVELRTDPSGNGFLCSGLAEAGSYGYVKAGGLLSLAGKQMTQRVSFDYAHAENDYPYMYDPTPHFESGEEQRKRVDNQRHASANAVYANRIDIASARHRLASQVSLMYSRNGLFNYAVADSNDGFSRDRRIAAIQRYDGQVSEMLRLRVMVSARIKENLFKREKPFYIGAPLHRLAQFPYLGALATIRFAFGPRYSVKGLAGGSYDGYAEQDLSVDAVSSEPYAHRLTARGGIEAECRLDEAVFARVKGVLMHEIDSTNGVSLQHTPDKRKPASVANYYPFVQGELRWEPNSCIALSLAGTHAKRSPSLHEKFARSNKSFGNQELLPETRMELDAGISIQTRRIRVSVSEFVNKTANKIKWVGVSQNVFVPRNIETINGSGLELEIHYIPVNWLSISNTLSYSRNSIDDADSLEWDGNAEPLLPRLKQRNDVQVVFGFFSFGHSLLYSTKYYRGPSNISSIEPGFECEAIVSVAPFSWLSLSYRIDNYLNAIDFTAADHETFERLPKPGRTHYAVLKIAL